MKTNSKLDRIAKGISDKLDKNAKVVDLSDAVDKPKKFTDDQVASFKKDYDDMLSEFKQKARSYVEQSVKFFLQLNHIDGDSYMETVTETKSMGLAELMIQLKIANDTVRKIYMDIQNSEVVNNRSVEVLTGLQRLILDIVKFKSDYFNKMNQSFILLKDMNEPVDDEPDGEIDESYTIDEVMEMLDDHMLGANHDKYLKTSKNPRLSGEEKLIIELENNTKIKKIEEYED